MNILPISSALHRGKLAFHLFSPCERCTRCKLGCSRTLHCKKCGEGHKCIPGKLESTIRAKRLYSLVSAGEFLHNDFARYQLSLESSVHGGKAVLGRLEMPEVHRRIYAPVASVIPVGDLSALPDCLKDHVGDHPVFKIEWLVNGVYHCVTSNSYASQIISGEEIMEIAKRHSIPPKIVDTLGLNDFEMGYRMWCESLFSPGLCISFTGSGFWREDGRLMYTTARIMSVIVSHTYIITTTTVGRGNMHVFGI